jgi:hypothetical protein
LIFFAFLCTSLHFPLLATISVLSLDGNAHRDNELGRAVVVHRVSVTGEFASQGFSQCRCPRPSCRCRRQVYKLRLLLVLLSLSIVWVSRASSQAEASLSTVIFVHRVSVAGGFVSQGLSRCLRPFLRLLSVAVLGHCCICSYRTVVVVHGVYFLGLSARRHLRDVSDADESQSALRMFICSVRASSSLVPPST